MLDTNLLIFDQDSPSLDNLRNRLTALGYHALPVTQSIDEVIEQITQEQPQIIIFNTPPGVVEKSLDTVGGLNILDVPMILVVSENDKKLLDYQTQAFQFDWIIKPIIDAELHATIKLALYRYKAKKKIIDQQQQLKAFAHSTGEGFITFGNHGKIIFMNMIAEMMTGWNQDEAFDKSLSEVITILENKSQNIIDISDLISDRADTGPLTEFSITLLSRNGNRIPVRARISPIRDRTGNIYGGVISFGNLSELQQAIQQARLHNQRSEALLGITAKLNSKLDLDNVLQALLEETTTITKTDGALVILLDKDAGTYHVVATFSDNNLLDKYKGNKYRLIKYRNENISGNQHPIRVFSDKNDIALEPYGDLLKDQKINTLALAPLNSDENILGEMFIISTEEARSYTEDELNFLKGLADQASLAITNARLFENINQSRFRLQILSKRLVEIQEAERRSLARELHDQIGQMLTGLQFTLESGKRASSDNTKPIFEDSQEIISNLIKQVRDLSLRLLPSMLEDIGLLPTLEWHFNQYKNQTNIDVNFTHAGLENNRFPHKIELTAYRIIQEGLTNTARYAQVNHVDVNIKVNDAIMHLVISDHGKGFDPEKTAANTQSFGLFGMKERVMLIGGDLLVSAAPDKGTKLEAFLPLGNHLERRKYAR